MDRPELNLWWGPRDPSEAGDAQRLSRFVSGLPNFDPIYRSWLNSPETGEEAVPVPLSEFGAKRLLFDNIARYDVGNRPWPEHGSDIWGGHAGPAPYDFSDSSYADTWCHIGGFGPPAINRNNIFMRLSNLRPSTGQPWRASELRPLMKFAREIWKPAEMCAKFSFCDPPRIPSPLLPSQTIPLRPWLGWITYLPPDLAARAKYPADVEVDTFEDGAALVTLCEEPFVKGDAEGLARMHALEAALRPIQS